MAQATPPFRADQVGSFLRSEPLKEARAKREKGAITAAQLKAVEDTEIEKLIKKQEEIGMQLVTDGEYRRAWWHFDFLEGLGGVEGYEADHGIQFAGVETKARGVRVTGKLHFNGHPFIDHFKFVKDHTKVTPKMTIPAPSVLHFRGGRKGISKDVYPDLDAFFDDLAKTYKDAVAAFYKAGCRYLQLDDTVWAYLCSQEGTGARQAARRRPDPAARDLRQGHQRGDQGPPLRHGDHHACLPRQFPLHLDFRGRLRAGGRDAVRQGELRRLFPRIRHRAGGRLRAAALRAEGQQADRARPRHLEVRHAGEERRHQEAHRGGQKFVALDQLCLSPQCGFASTEEGNVLTEDAQWAKMRMIVELSKEVWG